MDARTAYSKGYTASQRSVTADMDAAEDRFTAAHGTFYVDAWIAGWSDYSCGNGKWATLPDYQDLDVAATADVDATSATVESIPAVGPAVGTAVQYRHWESNPFHTGTIAGYHTGVSGTDYVTIKRDGYRETSVMEVSNLRNRALVTETAGTEVRRDVGAGTWTLIHNGEAHEGFPSERAARSYLALVLAAPVTAPETAATPSVRYIPGECRYCERYGRACGREHTESTRGDWNRTWDGHARQTADNLLTVARNNRWTLVKLHDNGAVLTRGPLTVLFDVDGNRNPVYGAVWERNGNVEAVSHRNNGDDVAADIAAWLTDIGAWLTAAE